METIQLLLSYLLHIDDSLAIFVSTYGLLAYIALFLIIFCETGLIITFFLPGDSLLFAAGGIAANPANGLNIEILFLSLLVASILGNKLNYLIGRFLSPYLFFSKENSKIHWLLSKKHLHKTQEFYARHGGKTIILARFVPIIRTFAPFVAGMSEMNLRQFSLFNILSAFLWIGSLLAAGYFFGSIPLIKNNFSLAIYILILISIMPPVITFFHHKLFKSKKAAT